MSTALPILCNACGKEIDPSGGMYGINGLRGSYHPNCITDVGVTPMARRVAEQAERIEELEEALHQIAQWTDAYPADIFTVPDSAWLKRAHEVLQADGKAIDTISAHVARHCLGGIGKIAHEALGALLTKDR